MSSKWSYIDNTDSLQNFLSSRWQKGGKMGPFCLFCSCCWIPSGAQVTHRQNKLTYRVALAGNKLNGCFTKSGWIAYEGFTKKNGHKEVDSLAKCALHCSTELDWCDGFNFHPHNIKGYSNCLPRSGTKLRAQGNTSTELRIGGWCPNNKGNHV